MAETFDEGEPTLSFRVRGDWTDFDNEVREREQHLEQTFGNESSSPVKPRRRSRRVAAEEDEIGAGMSDAEIAVRIAEARAAKARTFEEMRTTSSRRFKAARRDEEAAFAQADASVDAWIASAEEARSRAASSLPDSASRVSMIRDRWAAIQAAKQSSLPENAAPIIPSLPQIVGPQPTFNPGDLASAFTAVVSRVAATSRAVAAGPAVIAGPGPDPIVGNGAAASSGGNDDEIPTPMDDYYASIRRRRLRNRGASVWASIPSSGGNTGGGSVGTGGGGGGGRGRGRRVGGGGGGGGEGGGRRSRGSVGGGGGPLALAGGGAMGPPREPGEYGAEDFDEDEFEGEAFDRGPDDFDAEFTARSWRRSPRWRGGPVRVGFPPGGGGDGGRGGRGGGGGGGRGKGGILGSFWFRRFLALEAVRTVGGIANANREDDIRQALTLGDPAALAESDLKYWSDIESAVPFGIGHLLRYARDPFGEEEISVRLPLEQAKLADRVGAVRERYGAYVRGLGFAASEATPDTFRRGLTRVENTYQESISRTRSETAQLTTIRSQQFNADLNEANRRADTEFWNQFFTPWRLWVNSGDIEAHRSSAIRMIEGDRERSARIIAAQQDVATHHAETIRSEGIAAVVREQGWLKLGIQNQIAATTDLGLPWYEQEQRKAQREFQIEISRASVENPETVPYLQTLSQVTQNRIRVQQAATEGSRELLAKGRIAAARARGRGDTIAAARDELIASYQAEALDNSDPTVRERILRVGAAEEASLEARQRREIDIANTSNLFGTLAGRAALSRLPGVARILALTGQKEEAVAKLPQGDDPDSISLRDSTRRRYDVEIQLAQQEHRDRRALETQGLSLQEKVTGIYATAFGPGASARRAQGRVEQIAGEAELRAQTLLRHDISDSANADRERRIGINELGTFRANYIESLRAVEGSVFRTNFQNTSAGSPADILKSIDQGIKDLGNKIGTLVAAD